LFLNFCVSILHVVDLGEHERAVQLFCASQDLYKQLATHGSSVRHNLTANYGIAAPSLVRAALHACAKGKYMQQPFSYCRIVSRSSFGLIFSFLFFCTA